MTSIVRVETSKRYSRAVVYNGLVYLGGQTADDRSLDVKGQTKQALAKVDRYLAEAGTDKSRILNAQIWLRDIARDFADMNEVWDAWTAHGAAPARATAQCQMASATTLVEIVIVAATPE